MDCEFLSFTDEKQSFVNVNDILCVLLLFMILLGVVFINFYKKVIFSRDGNVL